MQLEVFVEELSAEAALEHVLPRILGTAWEVNYHPFQGKSDLLKSLPARLRGYSPWLPDDWRILVLIDEDREDCEALKRQLEDVAKAAGLTTKSSTGSGPFQVPNRIAVEELEAWFFGDVDALLAAYPKVPSSLGKKAGYRNPDAIKEGTWEALDRVLRKAGADWPKGGMPKVEVAQSISRHMVPDRNRSHSFRVFVEGLQALVRA